jgi:hypothetical protein
MAIRERDERLADLEPHTPAKTAAGDHVSEHNSSVRTTARADYAVRAAIELAAAGGLVNAEQIADAQDIPVNFLENILRDLRQAGTVESRRGRAVEGPLATCAGCSRRSRSPTSHAANCRRTSRS